MDDCGPIQANGFWIFDQPWNKKRRPHHKTKQEEARRTYSAHRITVEQVSHERQPFFFRSVYGKSKSITSEGTFLIISRKELLLFRQRPSGFFQEPDQFPEFRMGEMTDEFLVQLGKRLVECGQGLPGLLGKGDPDHPPILPAPLSIHESCLL